MYCMYMPKYRTRKMYKNKLTVCFRKCSVLNKWKFALDRQKGVNFDALILPITLHFFQQMFLVRYIIFLYSYNTHTRSYNAGIDMEVLIS